MGVRGWKGWRWVRRGYLLDERRLRGRGQCEERDEPEAVYEPTAHFAVFFGT